MADLHQSNGGLVHTMLALWTVVRTPIVPIVQIVETQIVDPVVQILLPVPMVIYALYKVVPEGLYKLFSVT